MSLQLMAHLVENGTPAVVPITVDQYMKMTALGIFREGAPIELIDGMLLFKDRRDGPTTAMTQGPRHLLAIKLLAQLLEQLLTADAHHVQQQGPIICSNESAPEPDLCILKGHPNDYFDALPTASDVELAVEISQTSLSLDQYDKADLYGQSGIPVYWIVNLADDTLIVRSQPKSPAKGYAKCEVFRRGMTVGLRLSDGESWMLSIDDLLPLRYEP